MSRFLKDKRELRRVRRLMVRTRLRVKQLERYAAPENERDEIERLKESAHRAILTISRGGLAQLEKFNVHWAQYICWCLIRQLVTILEQIRSASADFGEQVSTTHARTLKFIASQINFLSSDLSDDELELQGADVEKALVENETRAKLDGPVKAAEHAMASLLNLSSRTVGQGWKPRALEFFQARARPILVDGKSPLMPPLPDTRPRKANAGLAKAVKAMQKSGKK